MSADLRDQLQTALGHAYTLERELGGGGMARVFVATETALGRRVAIKVLPPDTSGVVSAERFKREIHLTAGLQHPLIVPVLGAGETGGLLHYAMPLVEGESLRARLAREGELPIAEAVRILRDVLEALAYAHRHGVVHRDIKPDNILLQDGHALVADFGVARALQASGAATGAEGLTSVGLALGTPAYMAPEQGAADPHVDHRADLYAAGVVAYEMLTGSHPFAGRPAAALLAAHATEPPEPVERRRPGVSPPLAALVMRLLEKRPADRPQAASEVLRELEAVTTPRDGMHVDPAVADDHSLAHRTRRPFRRRHALLAASALALALAGAGIWWLAAGVMPDGSAAIAGTPAGDRAGGGAGDPSATSRSLAVLPFVNLSSDAESDYFADGVTEELIAALGRLDGLRVPARSSVFALKGRGLDARALGDTLGVAAVLEGSVRRAGDRLRVHAQLVNAADGYQLWAETYERELRDVFAVQDEIARAIAGALHVRLAGATDRPLVQPPTRDLQAYDLYLRGRFAWNQRTGRSIQQAIEFYRQAIERDSTFALAYAGLADAYVVLPTYAFIGRAETNRLARAAALRAIALDSTLAEPHAALATVRADEYDWAGSERSFQRAIALNPGYATAYHWYTLNLWFTGRLDSARTTLARAAALDPLSRVIGLLPGIQRYFERDHVGAEAQFRKVLQLDANYAGAYQYLAMALAAQGRYDEALATAQRAAELLGVPAALHDSYIYAQAGREPEARAQLRELLRLDRRRYAPERVIALVYAALGETDSAFVWYERAIEARAPEIEELLVDPRVDPLRDDPRFARLVERMKLEPPRR